MTGAPARAGGRPPVEGRGTLPSALRRHGRFYAAALLGLGLGLAAAVPLGRTDAILMGANGFSLIYLVATALWIRGRVGDDLREHFADADEGGALIVLIALATIGASLYAIVEVVTRAGQPAAGLGAALRPALALAAVPLGWATIHTVMSMHYARLFYRPASEAEAGEGRGDVPGSIGAGEGAPRDAGGLDFADCDEPGPWEFLYYSFTLGMTAQTSDVALTRTVMRQVTLAHSALSFFYNAVIVALAVSAGMALTQGR